MLRACVPTHPPTHPPVLVHGEAATGVLHRQEPSVERLAAAASVVDWHEYTYIYKWVRPMMIPFTPIYPLRAAAPPLSPNKQPHAQANARTGQWSQSSVVRPARPTPLSRVTRTGQWRGRPPPCPPPSAPAPRRTWARRGRAAGSRRRTRPSGSAAPGAWLVVFWGGHVAGFGKGGGSMYAWLWCFVGWRS